MSNPVDSIIEFLKSGENLHDKVPNGFCPNCWGRQEYGSSFIDAVKKENIDLNNITKRRGWIQAYVARHLNGILLKQKVDKIHFCQQCYQPFDVVC